MKTFIGGLLVAFLFFASPVFSQSDTLIRIKPSTARYFLETEDKYHLLVNKDSLSQQIIRNLRTTLALNDSIVSSYKSDSVAYEQQLKLKDQEIRLVLEGSTILRRKLLVTKITSGIAIVIITLLAI